MNSLNSWAHFSYSLREANFYRELWENFENYSGFRRKPFSNYSFNGGN